MVDPRSSTSSAAPAPRGTANRSTTPTSDAFVEWIASGWADAPVQLPDPRAAVASAAAHRAAISALHQGERLVIPAGPPSVRSNDTDYPYRAHSAFTHLTGWGADTVAGSVLVLEPTEAGHDATLYFRTPGGRDTDEFYANPEIGEFWTGPRPSLEVVAADLDLPARDLAELGAVIDATDAGTRILRDADSELTDRVDGLRLLALDGLAEVDTDGDAALARDLSELRLRKDDWEAGQLRLAVEATRRGFDDVIAQLPRIVAHRRGERLIESAFDGRARVEGNTVGYDTIAASGPHACVLHWTRNDGPVLPGDLVLMDAGVELDSLYTADITRTFPVDGRFTEVQRRVYEAVLEAADAAFAIVRPGIRFSAVHDAAMAVIARRTAEWGMLPVSAEESLAPDAGYHRRYMIHGTSHHLGLDVHDCAQARREFYKEGIVEPGMVFTIEPGLYFQPDDLTVPEEYRGIGVRIEDDILVTPDGAENLSAAIPRTADAVEAWVRGAARSGPA